MYEYKMIQIPPTIEVDRKSMHKAAAVYLQGIVDENAVDGWEYYRVDTIGVKEKPGCFSQSMVTVNHYVVTFRRLKSAD